MSLENTVLVTGGTGKTGKRVAARLKTLGVPVRIGSRKGEPPFDWTKPDTWAPVLRDIRAAYITFQPDLAVPGAEDAIRTFTELAVSSGVQHLVLLSGRGEEEAERCEQIVQNSGVDWTVLRASWFSQNFSEDFLLDSVLSGEVVLPVADVPEPFVDVEDIAEMAVAALTQAGHAGKLYELTGPRLLTLRQAVGEIAAAAGRDIQFVQVSFEEFNAALEAQQVPADYIWLLNYLFTTVLDGRNASLTDDIERVLGRKPRDFAEYAQTTSATGVWNSVILSPR